MSEHSEPNECEKKPNQTKKNNERKHVAFLLYQYHLLHILFGQKYDILHIGEIILQEIVLLKVKTTRNVFCCHLCK